MTAFIPLAEQKRWLGTCIFLVQEPCFWLCHAFSYPSRCCFSGKKIPQMALMKAGILPRLRLSPDAVSGSSLQILLC